MPPLMLPILFTLNPCMAMMFYLTLQEASTIASRLTSSEGAGRNLYAIMVAATGAAALADLCASTVTLYWAPAGLSFQAMVFLGLAAIFFVYLPMGGMNDEAKSQELAAVKDTSPARAGHSILGFIGGFGACAVILSISSFFSYFSSGYWYFAPDNAMVAISYPTTTLFAKPLLDLGIIVSVIVSTILGIVWPRFSSFKSTGYALLLAGASMSFFAFWIHENSGSWYANLLIYTISLILLGIGAGLVIDGAMYLARDEVSRPFGLFLIGVILPFGWHIATTFPSAQTATETSEMMTWIYVLEGAALIFLVGAFLAWILYKNMKPLHLSEAAITRTHRRRRSVVTAAILLAVLAGTSFIAQFAMTGSVALPSSTTIQIQGEHDIGKPFGVNCHLSNIEDATDFKVDNPVDARLLTYAGCTWIRSDYWWANLFPNATGVFDRTFLSLLDKFVANTSSYGLKVQALLSYGQSWACVEDPYTSDWYNGHPTYSTYPMNITNWTNYIGFVAARYKGNASAECYEIYNEPNNEKYWCVNPLLFANLTVEAAMTIKKIDNATIVLGPGLSQTGLNDPRVPDTGHADRQFLVDWVTDADSLARNAGYTNGFGSLFDGVCLHPYGTWGSQVANYQALESYMSQQSTRFGKTFLIDNSETGYNTADPDAQPSVQAQEIAKAMIASQMLGVNMFIVYEYRDGSVLPPNYTAADRSALNGEDYFGIVDANRVPKPAYYAFGTVANLLNGGALLAPWSVGLTNPSMSSPAQGEIVNSAFRTKNGTVVLVLWREGTGIDSTSVSVHFTGTPASSPAAVMMYDPNSRTNRSWAAKPFDSSNVHIDGSSMTIQDIPVGENVTILEITNQSAIESYTMTLPPAFGIIILAPALMLGLAVGVIVVSLVNVRKRIAA